jgi:hypothetical protein
MKADQFGADLATDLISAHRGAVPAVVVAASNASDNEKARADYLCDGTADEVQINAAIQDNANMVCLSQGQFNIASSIDFNRDNVQLRGMGMNRTLLKAVNGFDSDVITNTKGDLRFFCRIEHLTVNGDRDNQTTGRGIYMHNAHTWTVQYLHVKNCWLRGIEIEGDDASHIALNNTIFRCRIESTERISLEVAAFAPNNHIINNIVGGNDSFQNMKIGNDETNVISNHIHGGGSVGLDVSTNNNNIQSNFVESSGTHGIELRGTGHNVQGNNVFNNGKGGSGSGIRINGDRMRVIGNRSYDKQGASGTQEYGLLVESGAESCYAVYNDFAENKTGAINGTGGTGTVITPNITT